MTLSSSRSETKRIEPAVISYAGGDEQMRHKLVRTTPCFATSKISLHSSVKAILLTYLPHCLYYRQIKTANTEHRCIRASQDILCKLRTLVTSCSFSLPMSIASNFINNYINACSNRWKTGIHYCVHAASFGYLYYRLRIFGHRKS